MKVGFAALASIRDPSATQNAYYMYQALMDACGERALAIDDLRVHGALRLLLGARKTIRKSLLGDLSPVFASRSAIKSYGIALDRMQKKQNLDLLLANQAFLIADLPNPRQPVAVHMDASVLGLLSLGSYMEGWNPTAITNLLDAERRALQAADMIFVTSEWAREHVVVGQGIDRGKVSVIPIGANIDHSTWPLKHDESVTKFTSDFAFLGGDWERKGGSHALRVVSKLRENGLSCRLVVVGPRRHPAPRAPHVEYLGPLHKSSSPSSTLIRNRLKECAAMLLPTHADCTPAAVAELAALGVPSITSDVGGLPSTVLHQVTGLCMPAHTSVEDWASAVAKLIEDRPRLASMRSAAHERYLNEMNWDVISARILTAASRF